MHNTLLKGIVFAFVIGTLVVGIGIAYNQYQWYELEKVEHEVDKLYTTSVNLRNK